MRIGWLILKNVRIECQIPKILRIAGSPSPPPRHPVVFGPPPLLSAQEPAGSRSYNTTTTSRTQLYPRRAASMVQKRGVAGVSLAAGSSVSGATSPPPTSLLPWSGSSGMQCVRAILLQLLEVPQCPDLGETRVGRTTMVSGAAEPFLSQLSCCRTTSTTKANLLGAD